MSAVLTALAFAVAMGVVLGMVARGIYLERRVLQLTDQLANARMKLAVISPERKEAPKP